MVFEATRWTERGLSWRDAVAVLEPADSETSTQLLGGTNHSKRLSTENNNHANLDGGMSEAKVLNWLLGFGATSYWGIIFLFFKQRKAVWLSCGRLCCARACCCWLFLAPALIHCSSGSKTIILPCNSSILLYLCIWHFRSALALCLNIS